jgi:hypothetical protein
MTVKTPLPAAFRWTWAVWAVVLIWHPIIALYLIPAAISFQNRRPNAQAILGWNIFLGWTPMWFLLAYDGIKNANPRTYGVPPPPRPRRA